MLGWELGVLFLNCTPVADLPADPGEQLLPFRPVFYL